MNLSTQKKWGGTGRVELLPGPLQKLEIGRADNDRRRLAKLDDYVLGLAVANSLMTVLIWSRNSEVEIVLWGHLFFDPSVFFCMHLCPIFWFLLFSNNSYEEIRVDLVEGGRAGIIWSGQKMEAVMATLTIEVPEELARQIENRGFSPQRLERMFIDFVQVYLREIDAGDEAQPTTARSFLLDGETFARRVIAQNRELFEELARL